jgi:hypothetical protein
MISPRPRTIRGDSRGGQRTNGCPVTSASGTARLPDGADPTATTGSRLSASSLFRREPETLASRDRLRPGSIASGIPLARRSDRAWRLRTLRDRGDRIPIGKCTRIATSVFRCARMSSATEVHECELADVNRSMFTASQTNSGRSVQVGTLREVCEDYRADSGHYPEALSSGHELP